MKRTAPALQRLADDDGEWTVWPIHTVRPDAPWTTPGGIALIGDAAHAMTPYAAQGAAMAIEDGETLAGPCWRAPTASPPPLPRWEKERRQRIDRVARRGGSTASPGTPPGPSLPARNLVLRVRKPESLAAGLDWLYGWTPPALKL